MAGEGRINRSLSLNSSIFARFTVGTIDVKQLGAILALILGFIAILSPIVEMQSDVKGLVQDVEQLKKDVNELED